VVTDTRQRQEDQMTEIKKFQYNETTSNELTNESIGLGKALSSA